MWLLLSFLSHLVMLTKPISEGLSYWRIMSKGGQIFFRFIQGLNVGESFDTLCSAEDLPLQGTSYRP